MNYNFRLINRYISLFFLSIINISNQQKHICHFIFTVHKIFNQFLCLVAGNIEMPDAMETIFQSALAFGRHGGVSICFSFLTYVTIEMLV